MPTVERRIARFSVVKEVMTRDGVEPWREGASAPETLATLVHSNDGTIDQASYSALVGTDVMLKESPHQWYDRSEEAGMSELVPLETSDHVGVQLTLRLKHIVASR